MMDAFIKIYSQLDKMPNHNKTFGTNSKSNVTTRNSYPINRKHLKGVGRGRLTMAGGQVDGLRGNNHKADLRQRGGAQVATTGVLVHRGQTHRPNARGIRAKPQTNTTAGETQSNNHLDRKKNFSFSFIISFV